VSDTTPPGRGKQAGRFRFQFLAKIRNLQILASLDITCGGGIYLLSGSSASYLWMDFSNSMPGKPGKSAFVEFRHVSDGISCNVHTDWLWMGNAWKGACDDLQTRSARNAKCETSLNEKITRFNIPANLVGIRHLEGLAVATFAV